MATLGELLVIIRANTGAFTRDMSAATARLTGFGSTVRALSTTIGLTTLALGVLGAKAVQEAAKFEAAFAKVKRVLSDDIKRDGVAAVNQLREEILLLSRAIPLAAVELAKIAEIGGQMGVPAEKLAKFTDTVARLSEATGLSGAKVAADIGRIAAATGEGVDAFDRLGSAAVSVADSHNSTAAEILSMTMRMAPMAAAAGFTASQLMGYSAAMKESGVQTFAGATAMGRMIIKMRQMAGEGGSAAKELARISNAAKDAGDKLSQADFSKLVLEDTNEAFLQFTEGLRALGDSGEHVDQVLTRLIGSNVRTTTAILALTNSTDGARETVQQAERAYAENVSLMEKSETVFDTAVAKWQLLKNAIGEVGINAGSDFLPALSLVLVALAKVINLIADASNGFKGYGRTMEGIGAVTTTVTSPLSTLNAGMISLGKTFGVIEGDEGIIDYFDNLAESITGASSASATSQEDFQKMVQENAAIIAEKFGFPLGKPGQETGGAPLDDDAQEKFLAVLQKQTDSLGKLRATSNSTYASMLEDIRQATEAREQEITDIGVVGEELETLLSQSAQITALAQENARSDFLRSIFGEAPGDAARSIRGVGTAIELMGGIGVLTLDQLGAALDKLGGEGASGTLADRLRSQIGEFDLDLSSFDPSKFFPDTGIGFGIGFPDEIDPPDISELLAEVDAGISADRKKRAEELGKEFDRLANKNTDWNEVLRRSADLMEVLGIEADSTLGVIIGTFTGGGAFTQAVSGEFERIGRMFEIMGEKGEEIPKGFEKLQFIINNIDLGSLIQGIVALAGALKNALDIGSDLGRALATAKIGADLGGQIGQFFGPTGKLVGTIAGAITGGLFGFFRKPKWKKVGEEAGRILGIEVSKSFAKQIEALADSLDISVEAASLLSIPQAISESGQGALSFATQAIQLIQGVAEGTIPLREGLESIDDVFNQIREDAEGMGAAGMAALSGMVVAARELGIESDSINAFIDEMFTQMATGINQFVEGMEINEDNIATVATLFSSTFWAAVEENGLLAAAEAFQPAFDKLKESIEELGLDPEIFADIFGAFDLAANEAFAGASEAAIGLASAMEAMGNIGIMNVETFGDFGAAAQAAFTQALEASGDPTTAMQAILPILQQIIQQSQAFGFEIDENTQALIDQAGELGFSFSADPVVELTNAIRELIEAITGVPSEISVNTTFTSSGTLPPGMPGQPDEEGLSPDITAASGFFSPSLPRDTLIQAHQGETVSITPANGGFTGGGGNVSSTIESLSINVSVPSGDPEAISAALERDLSSRLRTVMNEVATEAAEKVMNG